VAFGAQRSPNLAFTGEIHAIYLLSRVQKRGLGRTLMHVAAHGLRDGGHRNASLWAMTENTSALDFYLHLGARPVGTTSFELDGVTVAETALAWDNLATLLSS
jgi:GNAT superfamily N-acetyltransferase